MQFDAIDAFWCKSDAFWCKFENVDVNWCKNDFGNRKRAKTASARMPFRACHKTTLTISINLLNSTMKQMVKRITCRSMPWADAICMKQIASTRVRSRGGRYLFQLKQIASARVRSRGGCYLFQLKQIVSARVRSRGGRYYLFQLKQEIIASTRVRSRGGCFLFQLKK